MYFRATAEYSVQREKEVLSGKLRSAQGTTDTLIYLKG